MKNIKSKTILCVLGIFLLCIIANGCGATKKNTSEPITYESFKLLSNEEKKTTFANMTGKEIYDLVNNSDENWPVTSYDLITPDNAKEMIILVDNNGDLHFNLDWPHYGGYIPSTIASVADLAGCIDISRDGGDGGYCMSIGKNDDGSYPNNDKRSVPKTSATVKTGILDIDNYKAVVDVVVSGESKETRITKLCTMGYTQEIAEKFIKDQEAWLTRDEVSGPDNIADGVKLAGNTIDGRYGYYGKTAPWNAGNLNLSGGSRQINTVFSWGTLRDSGLMTNVGTAEIH
ncbi:MAG: hypothetical protein K5917_01685 [Clostridiales bacterium]|nr:hypothetical protein [Clostridiales bacterium]